MKLTLAEPRFLKESMSIISDLVTETRIKVNKDYLEIVAMDPANVAMVIFRMPNNVFAEYEVQEETIISINLNNLKQVLRRVKGTDVLTLEKQENKLKVLMKNKSVRTFHLPLIDLDEDQQKIPSLEFKTDVTLKSSDLNEAIEDAEIVGESVTIGCKENKFIVSASGDLTRAEVVMNPDDEITIKTEGDHSSKYSTEYLKKMIQGSKLSDTAKVKFSTNYPLSLEYLVKDKMSLSFILAPRVDND